MKNICTFGQFMEEVLDYLGQNIGDTKGQLTITCRPKGTKESIPLSYESGINSNEGRKEDDLYEIVAILSDNFLGSDTIMAFVIKLEEGYDVFWMG